MKRRGPEEKEGIEGEYRPCMCVHNPAGKGKERGIVCHKDKLSHHALGWKKLQLPSATPEGCAKGCVAKEWEQLPGSRAGENRRKSIFQT